MYNISVHIYVYIYIFKLFLVLLIRILLSFLFSMCTIVLLVSLSGDFLSREKLTF